ncbi:hypothetical protein VPH35_088929 [Triticum aestivum]
MTHDDFKIHVRLVIEDLPMQLWSLEGAEEALGDRCRVDRLDSRTFEQDHTKTFGVWVWVWDVSHIPTKRALWFIKRGAGRTEEMYGFSLPSRDVPPPPWVRRRDLLIHVDRVEDWTLLSPRSSSSPQSGFPSSESEVDTSPFPAVYTGTWHIKVEDGRATADHGRSQRSRPVVVSTGCHGMPFEGHRRSHDGDDGGGRRSWKDTLLGRRRSSRGSNRTEVPVAHRATLRIIRDLGLLGPKDNMTPQATKAPIKKFDEPLTEDDIIGLAKLTRQDPAALRIAAGLAGPDGAPLGEKA